MTEKSNTTQEFGPITEYSEVYIGECTHGDCDRPATVRVHESFVLCALHHLRYEIAHEYDAANLALELIGGWRSIASTHHNGYLLELFEYAHVELIERRAVAEERTRQLERVEMEGNEDIRSRMGEVEATRKIEYPTVFAKVLSDLSGNLGDDWSQLALDLVSAIGEPYGDAERDALQARLGSAAAPGPSGVFMDGLARYLDLGEEDRMRLAAAYAYEGAHED